MKKIPSFDLAEAKVDTRIKHISSMVEDIERNTSWGIRRWDNKRDWKEQLRADKNGEGNILQYDMKEAVDIFGMPQVSKFNGNILLYEGVNELWKLATGGTATAWGATTGSYLGVGDSATGEDATHTGLQAASNKYWVQQDATYPIINGTNNNVCNWKSTFTSANGNYAWQEYTLTNAANDAGKNLNRKVSSQGTKQSGQTWELTLSITLS